MPVGYVLSTLVVAVCVACALYSPHPRRSRRWRLSFWFAYLVNELPFQTFFALVGATVLAAAQGDLVTTGGAIGAGVGVVTTIGLVVIVRRAVRAGPVLAESLAMGFAGGDSVASPRRRRNVSRWLRIIGWPFPWWFRGDVARHADIVYGPDGRHHRLDVFRPTRRPPRGPLLVHFHGGAFRVGRKNLECRPLINRLVSQGWICISANYRLGHDGGFFGQLVDVKRAIAWTKHHAVEYGADPTQLYVAGSSAGGHLAAVAGLTPNDPRFQPGFEADDTTAAAVIVLSGYYGSMTTDGPPSSPHDYVTERAPSFAIVHGDQDTIVVVEDARAFADHLRSVSEHPVVYAELPGAHHDFDLFHSVRFEAVIDALEAFTAAVSIRSHRSR